MIFFRSEFDEFDHNTDSGGSADEDDHDFTDADAAIDRMLDELQDFTLVSIFQVTKEYVCRGCSKLHF